MNTDSQGRPLSEDGQWVWNGSEWVPAAGAAGGVAAGAVAANGSGSASAATMIAPAPAATPISPATPPQQAYAGAPAQQSPAYQPGPSPAGFGAGGNTPPYGANFPYVPPAPQKSRKPLVFGVIATVLLAAGVAVALIFTLGGDKKKTASTKPAPAPTHGPAVPQDSPKPTDQPSPQPTDGPSDIPITEGPVGAYTCSVSGSTETGVITFNNGAYTLSDNGKPGSYTVDGDTITFQGGSLDGADTTYDSTLDEVDIQYQGTSLTCTA